MKKLALGCICLITVLAFMTSEACALDTPTFELEKVIGNVYVGKQSAPLDPVLGTGPGTYLTVNLYAIVSEDKKEIILIDAPGLMELFPLFITALESEFPGAAIKAVLLTHDHLDHSWSIPYFFFSGVPIYASAEDISAELGPYDFPVGAFATPIEPGTTISFGDGIIEAIDLKGHTSGLLGYAYYPEGVTEKINWFFAGDALLAPQDYGTTVDPLDITYPFRLKVLNEDTFSYPLWIGNLNALKGQLTNNAKLFPAHGAVRDGYLWREPADYIDHTIAELRSFQQ